MIKLDCVFVVVALSFNSYRTKSIAQFNKLEKKNHKFTSYFNDFNRVECVGGELYMHTEDLELCRLTCRSTTTFSEILTTYTVKLNILLEFDFFQIRHSIIRIRNVQNWEVSTNLSCSTEVCRLIIFVVPQRQLLMIVYMWIILSL